MTMSSSNFELPNFDLQGHRGARGLYPENTLAGFAAAIALGITTIELDIVVTADGLPVVSHDPRLNPDITRRSDGSWLSGETPRIRDLTFAELQAFDVGRIRPGTAYAAAFPEQQPIDGATIPSLAEVFALDPRIKFNLEIKTFPDHPTLTLSPATVVERVIAVADVHGVASRIAIQAFDWRVPRYVRQHRPEIRVGWLTAPQSDDERLLWWDGLTAAQFGGSVPHAVAAEAAGAAEAMFWLPQYAELNVAVIAEAQGLGLAVIPWDVESPADMRRALSWGVDGFITDRPDLARDFLQR
jgi:glycerophosphoryl diester phosphodiesterase